MALELQAAALPQTPDFVNIYPRSGVVNKGRILSGVVVFDTALHSRPKPTK